MLHTRMFVLALALLALGVTACGASGLHRPAVAERHRALTWLGAAQDIVSTQVPDGPAFAIVGRRYSFGGHVYLAISNRFAEPWRVADGGLESKWSGSRLLSGDIAVTAGCQVRLFSTVAGLLKTSDDVAFVQAGGKSIHLRQIALPTSLRTKAVLVYGVTWDRPSAFALRTPDGKVVHLRKLSWNRSFPEGCEGPERAWVVAHFKPVLAEDALARIAECMRGKGFEVGAPDEPGLDFVHTAMWRQFTGVQKLCRMQIAAAMAIS